MKGLEALDNLRKYINPIYGKNLIQQYQDASENTKIIEKELKALKIIKEKNVDVIYLHCECNCLEDYNENNQTCELDKDEYLTQEEYNLLKEVLC